MIHVSVDVQILQHTGLYPIVSKGMRLIAQGKDPLDGQRHMCGMGNMFHYHSTGFPELDEIMRTPQPLIFIMELLQVSASVTKLNVIVDSPEVQNTQQENRGHANISEKKRIVIYVLLLRCFRKCVFCILLCSAVSGNLAMFFYLHLFFFLNWCFLS